PCPQTTVTASSSALWTSAGRSPPGPLRCGSTTCNTNPALTAASTALPPRSSTDIAVCEASQCVLAAIPNVPVNSGRVAIRGIASSISPDGQTPVPSHSTTTSSRCPSSPCSS